MSIDEYHDEQDATERLYAPCDRAAAERQQAEEDAKQACHFCGEQATAIIHHKVEGEVHVCGACHLDACESNEIANIPTKLL